MGAELPVAPGTITAADVDLPTLVQRYLDGESMTVLAAEHGCNRRTLYRYMLAGLGEERYRDVVTHCLVARIADADEMLEGASDQLKVSKAREMAKFARMDFEWRRPALYGPKQEVNHTSDAPMFSVVLLDRPSGPEGGLVIEGTVPESRPAAPVEQERSASA